MQRRKWDSKTKAMIVLQGLKGKNLAELCNEHQITQAQYCKWRDQFLSNASKAFETANINFLEMRRKKTILGL